MADLKSVIRVKSWELDERKRELGELRDAENDMENRLVALEVEVAKESEAARTRPDTAVTYGAYAAEVRRRRERMEAQLELIRKEIEGALDRLREAFEEAKKLELAQERRLEAEAEKQAKKEAEELDEIGLNQYRMREVEKEG